MKTEGWCKPFIASIIVTGLALLILWFFVWNVIDELRRRINRILGFATGLFDPVIEFFTELFNYVSNNSEDILRRINNSIDKISSILSGISDPATGLRVSQLLRDKVKTGYKKGKEENQHNLNVSLSKVTNADNLVQDLIVSSLDSIDNSIFNNLGSRTEFIRNIRKFVSDFVNGLDVINQ